jgi:phenylacetate-CoA ligase
MTSSETFYHLMPVAVQNVLVTAYGLARRRKRFGPGFDEALREIEATRHMEPHQIEELQTQRLIAIVQNAAARVPYYRRTFREHGIRPSRIRDRDHFRRLPLLLKSEVQRHGPDMRTEGIRPFWINSTSGSTGTPLAVSLDRYTYQLSTALVVRHERDHGIGDHDRRATFGGRLVQAVTSDEPPFWRYNWAERQLLMSTYHMNDRNLAAYLTRLERFGPAELIGYPSALFTLADYVRRIGPRPSLPLKAIITNSETLLEWQRSVIEAELGAPVYDYYGTAESVAFAGQCSRLRYHPDPLIGLYELVDDDGRPVSGPEPGRLVCTTLSNRAMPLIRYDSGDVVVPLEHPCECGRPGAVWERIEGRRDDQIRTPEGRIVARLANAFKGTVGVREAQIVQTAADRLEVRVVAGSGYGPATEARIRENLAERVGPAMQVAVSLVSDIERTARGKFKGVVRAFERG